MLHTAEHVSGGTHSDSCIFFIALLAAAFVRTVSCCYM